MPTPTVRRPAALLVSLAALLLILASGLGPGPRPAAGQTAATPSPGAATPAATNPLGQAVAYLLAQQQPDGGFPGTKGTSDAGATVDALLALAAAGRAGIGVGAVIASATAWLAAGDHALVYAQTGGGQSAKLVLAAVATGGNPRAINGVDPLLLAEHSAKPPANLYGSGVFDHALVILALAATGQPVPAAAFDALAATVHPDGSWAYDGTAATPGDSNTTALVVQALAAAGRRQEPLVANALAYLRTVQAPSGAFAYQAAPGTAPAPDANSTALAVQALIAAGQNPAGADWRNAAGALLAFQNPSGAFRYTDADPADNLFATVQAIPALAGQALPIRRCAPTPSASDGTGIATAAAGVASPAACPAAAGGTPTPTAFA